MSAAGESSSEAAPLRYRGDCKKTAELIKDEAKAAAGGRLYVPFPPEQSGTPRREIRLEYDTGVALVVTPGKRPTRGIDLATRGLAEALADMAAHEGVTGSVVLYDCMLRFRKISDDRILAARAERVAACRAAAKEAGEDARPRRSQRDSHAHTSEKHREKSHVRGSKRHRDPAQSSRRCEEPNVDDISRFRHERSGGGGQPSYRDDAFYYQEEGGSSAQQRYRQTLDDLFSELDGIQRRVEAILRGEPSDPRDIERLNGLDLKKLP